MLYSDKVLEHFANPHNVGEIPDADGVGLAVYNRLLRAAGFEVIDLG